MRPASLPASILPTIAPTTFPSKPNACSRWLQPAFFLDPSSPSDSSNKRTSNVKDRRLPVLRLSRKESCVCVNDHTLLKEARDTLVDEPFLRRRKLAQLMANHVLRHIHWHVCLPIVHHEPDPKCTASPSAANPSIRIRERKKTPEKLLLELVLRYGQ